MAYKTQKEKRAYRTGLFAGLKRRKKPYNPSKGSPKRSSSNKYVKRRNGQTVRNDNPFGMTYMQLIREEEQRKRDLFGDFD